MEERQRKPKTDFLKEEQADLTIKANTPCGPWYLHLESHSKKIYPMPEK